MNITIDDHNGIDFNSDVKDCVESTTSKDHYVKGPIISRKSYLCYYCREKVVPPKEYYRYITKITDEVGRVLTSFNTYVCTDCDKTKRKEFINA